MKTKHILIGLAAVAVVGGAYLYFTKDKKDDKNSTAKKTDESKDSGKESRGSKTNERASKVDEKTSNCSGCSGQKYSNVVKEFKLDSGLSGCPSGCMHLKGRGVCRCNVD